MLQLLPGGFLKSVDKDTSFTEGSILFRGSSVVSEDNDNLFWDDTNKRLGVGTKTPNNALEIVGARPQLRLSDGSNFVELAMSPGVDGVLRLHGQTQAVLNLQAGATGGKVFQYETAEDHVQAVPGAAFHYYVFEDATSGETKEFRIYGYRAGDDLRSLQIGVGIDADDTASFDGVSNYYFDGNVGIGTSTPSSKLQVAGAISSANVTITASSNTLDVSEVNTVFIDISADIVLGGLVGGVNGQVVNFAFIGNFVNHCRFEHAAGVGGSTQDFINHTSADEDIDHGGCIYVCNGTNWYDVSHARHV